MFSNSHTARGSWLGVAQSGSVNGVSEPAAPDAVVMSAPARANLYSGQYSLPLYGGPITFESPRIDAATPDQQTTDAVLRGGDMADADDPPVLGSTLMPLSDEFAAMHAASYVDYNGLLSHAMGTINSRSSAVPVEEQQGGETPVQASDGRVRQRRLWEKGNEAAYKCTACHLEFKSQTGWEHHVNVKNGHARYSCTFCRMSFFTTDALKRHAKGTKGCPAPEMTGRHA